MAGFVFRRLSHKFGGASDELAAANSILLKINRKGHNEILGFTRKIFIDSFCDDRSEFQFDLCFQISYFGLIHNLVS